MAESFNGKLMAECLNIPWFSSLENGRSKCETWPPDHNEFCPHSSIGHNAPIELVRP